MKKRERFIHLIGQRAIMNEWLLKQNCFISLTHTLSLEKTLQNQRYNDTNLNSKSVVVERPYVLQHCIRYVGEICKLLPFKKGYT